VEAEVQKTVSRTRGQEPHGGVDEIPALGGLKAFPKNPIFPMYIHPSENVPPAEEEVPDY
jgi:hypothetical protein